MASFSARAGTSVSPPVPWMELDSPHPFCERRISLDIASDYFFEIANDLPGQTEYNALISLYRKKYWGELDRAIAVFVKTFERSPLREAVVFLDAQSQFDRVEGNDDGAARTAEKALRNALLLYPKSKLAPVLCATSANFWLARGSFERALAMYRSSLQTYEGAPMACVFKMGIGETSYQLRDWPAAEANLKDVLSTCHNFPLRAAAQVRLTESALQQDKPAAVAALEKQLETDGGYLERFHPSVFYNLGELKYHAGIYEDAKFYFQEYLRNERKEGPCVPGAMKRMADISYREHQPLTVSAGKYLELGESFRNSDFGRFAYAHALLMTLDDAKRPELNRRVSLVDEAANSIVDSDLKTRLFLEKGLATLAWGEAGSLGFLTHLRKQKPAAVEGLIGAFIRAHVRRLIENDFAHPPEDKDPVTSFEERYRDWLAASPDESWARKFYARVLTERAEASFAKGERKAALSSLDRWHASELWEKTGPDSALRDRVAIAILRDLVGPGAREAAVLYVERAASLQPFLSPELAGLVAYVAGDAKPIQQYLKGEHPFPKAKAPLLAGYEALLLGQAQHKEKNFLAADRTLSSINEPTLQSAKLSELVGNFRDNGKFDRAYTVAVKRYATLPVPEKPAALTEIAHLVRDGKLWSKANEVRSLAEKSGINGKDLASFEYLAGRAAFERANCPAAVKAYQHGIELDPIAPEIPEARFRLGKCLVKSRQVAAAKSEYDQLVKMQDSFWSPLARNELKLLSK